MPLFAIRPELATQVGTRTWLAQCNRGTFVGAGRASASRSAGVAADRSSVSGASVSIFVESRGATANDVLEFAAINAGWQLRLQHAAGSLDAAVGARAPPQSLAELRHPRRPGRERRA